MEDEDEDENENENAQYILNEKEHNKLILSNDPVEEYQINYIAG